ncbi:hypothetical protein D3C72_1578120 [compost metagenome]
MGDAAAPLLAVRHAVDAQRGPQDVLHRVPGVQRGVRILEDHLHALAIVRQPARIQPAGVLAAQQDPARGRRKQPHQGAGQSGFAAARFSDQAQGFARGDLERYAVHRGGDAPTGLILHAQVLHLQQRN